MVTTIYNQECTLIDKLFLNQSRDSFIAEYSFIGTLPHPDNGAI